MNYKLSLSKKIILLSLSGILILLICSLFTIKFTISDLIEDQKGLMHTSSESISNGIQDQFYERYGDVQIFSLRFQNKNQTRLENESYLNTFAAMYGIYNLIIAVDLKGNLIGINTKNPEGVKIETESFYNMNFANESWFKGVIEKKFLEDKSKGFENVHFEDASFNPLIEKAYGKKVFGTIFSTYIKNERGEPIGVISTHADFKWVENIFTREYDKNSKKIGFYHSEYTLINKNGDVIIDYDPSFQNNKNNIIHDENILNKLNLSQIIELAKNLYPEKNEGLVESLHLKKNITQYIYFQFIKGPKIIDNLRWSTFVRIDKGELLSPIYKIVIIISCIFLVVILLIIFLNILFSRYLAKKLSDISEKLFQGGGELLKTAENTLRVSQELSAASSEQASSLQETVAAVTEISSMLARTADMSSQSQATSEQSSTSVEKGKHAVNDMIDAIQNIKNGNEDIFKQVEEGNKKISNIVQLIGDIETKTKVINEIVFQTKLLSFNASVEAARAGEHGKGFAVVAEEVGNLAQMSGTASKEISALLEQSTTKVKSIVSDISSKVGILIQNATNKVKEGEKTGLVCVNNFERIYENTTHINNNINEIMISTKEQSKGVEEITQAMHELDSVTQRNSHIAINSSKEAENLLEQSKNIENIANYLIDFIQGKKRNSGTDTSSQSTNSPKSNKGKETTKNKINKNPSPPKLSLHQATLKSLENYKNKKENTEVQKVPSADDPRFEDL